MVLHQEGGGTLKIMIHFRIVKIKGGNFRSSVGVEDIYLCRPVLNDCYFLFSFYYLIVFVSKSFLSKILS